MFPREMLDPFSEPNFPSAEWVTTDLQDTVTGILMSELVGSRFRILMEFLWVDCLSKFCWTSVWNLHATLVFARKAADFSDYEASVKLRAPLTPG